MRLHHWLLISVFALFLLAFGIGILIVGFWLFPSAPVGEIEMQLPGSPRPPGMDEEFDPDRAVVIVAHVALGDADQGKIGALAVQTKRGRTTIPIAEWRPRLVDELRQLRQDPSIQDHVRIEGEKRLKWASVVEIMDACKEAGFNNIGFAPPPDQ